MTDIDLRGELWDNDSADILRWWGWKDITCPADIRQALADADGDEVTLLINSPGGDMTVGLEIRSLLRRYPGKTTALYQGHGASAATLAASGCTTIISEPGALLCYHNPMSGAQGDWRDMAKAAEGLKNARDCIIEVYSARKGAKSPEELEELMAKDIWISPTQALEYGLIDSVAEGIDSGAHDPASYVAAAGSRLLITADMRERYTAAMAEKHTAEKTMASCARAKLRVLANY